MGAYSSSLNPAAGSNVGRVTTEEGQRRTMSPTSGQADMWPHFVHVNAKPRGHEDPSSRAMAQGRGAETSGAAARTISLQQWRVSSGDEVGCFLETEAEPVRMTTFWAAPGEPGLTTLAECHQPLLLDLGELLGDSPRDFATFSGLVSHTISTQIGFAQSPHWEKMYAKRWPSFHACIRHQGVHNWRVMYRDTLAGHVVCTMEVLDREKKLGFAMAAMAADVQYEAKSDSYICRYLSASEVMPETVPVSEGDRLRFCPDSAQASLTPRCLQLVCPATASKTKKEKNTAIYPYKVLEGFSDLKVGRGVELQWKMQQGSPFGWWYGHLESLDVDPNGETALATITFRHFPTGSRWYRLEVRFGDSEMRTCIFGGYTGGIRAVSDAEHQHWMRYFPKEPVVF